MRRLLRGTPSARNAVAFAILAGAFSQVVSCSDRDGPENATAVATTAGSPMLQREGCEPRAPVMRGPVSDPHGPYYHQVAIARTTDGLSLTGAHQVLDHASVPDGVRRANGEVLVYYVNAQDGGVWVAKVDGDSVTALGPVTVDGVAAPAGMVDPDATALPGGGVRLIYFASFMAGGGSRTSVMCIADSEDGRSFVVRGRAIAFDETTTDPSITRLADGTWLLAASQGQKTVLARSDDGFVFQESGSFSGGGVPEVAALPDGSVRLYVCARGVEAYRSTNGGTDWALESRDIAPGLGHKIVCDPSYVPGAGLFIYKTGD